MYSNLCALRCWMVVLCLRADLRSDDDVGKVSGSVVSMDFTADGVFVMLNSSGMDMVIASAETCNKASSKDMKALRYVYRICISDNLKDLVRTYSTSGRTPQGVDPAVVLSPLSDQVYGFC